MQLNVDNIAVNITVIKISKKISDQTSAIIMYATLLGAKGHI